MKIIQKKSTVEIPPINGAVVDTLNVEDKITNAPSVRVVEELANTREIPHDIKEVTINSITNFSIDGNYLRYDTKTKRLEGSISFKATSQIPAMQDVLSIKYGDKILKPYSYICLVATSGTSVSEYYFNSAGYMRNRQSIPVNVTTFLQISFLCQ